MAIRAVDSAEQDALEIHASVHFIEGDYDRLEEIIPPLVGQSDGVRALLILKDFCGWETDRLYKRRKLASKNKHQVKRVIVGGEL